MDMLALLEVAIGIVLVYLILSLVCTSLVQAWLSWGKTKPKILRQSIEKVIGKELANSVYKNAEVEALKGPTGRDPSYIPTDVFARSVLDIATQEEWRKSGGLPSVLRDKFVEFASKNGNSDEKKALGKKLTELIDEAGGDFALFQNKIELWFDRTGDRSKGWFKRAVNNRLIILGFIVAAAVNADSILIFQRLADDPALRQAAVELATEQLKPGTIQVPENPDEHPALEDIRKQVGSVAPFIGWSQEDPVAKAWGSGWFWGALGIKLIGLVITAFAISLGSPFWFDLLQKLVNIRKEVAADRAVDMSKGQTGDDKSDAKTDSGKTTEGGNGADADPTPVYSGAMSGFAPLAANLHLGNAYWMANIANISYEQERAKVEATVESWGMTAHLFETKDPAQKKLWGGFSIDEVDTQGFLASDENVALVVFRGTEPSKPADILTDLKKTLVSADDYGEGQVHEGFKEAIDSVWEPLQKLLEQHAAKQQPVWFAGHSLGGALAVLAASRWDKHVATTNKNAKKAIDDAEKAIEKKIEAARNKAQDPDAEINVDTSGEVSAKHDAMKQLLGRVAGVYTIGQPRVGDEDFAKDVDSRFDQRHVRVINNRDVVPRVPPRAMEFEHSGTVLYLDEFGRLHRDPGLWFRLLDSVVISRDEIAKAREGVQDHSAAAYVDLLDKVRKSGKSHAHLGVS